MVRDANAFVQEDTLFLMPDGNDYSGWQGIGLVRYDIAKIRDVRNLGSRAAYTVRCTVRIRVFSDTPFDLAHDTPRTWAGYPAALINLLQPSVPTGAPDLDIKLVEYSPKTVNSSVNTDVAQVVGTDTTLTRQHTIGSATTVTNSFGANLGVDAEGAPSGGVNFEHAETTESRNEWMDAANRGASLQSSASAGMTIKDWASFARLGVAGGVPNIAWVWAQEYPWDAVLLRPTGSDDTQMAVPKDVQLRMSRDGYIQPPSHLSQMGFDFISRSTWLVTPKAWSATEEPQLAVTHSGVFWQATHAAAKADDSPVTIQPHSTTYGDGGSIVHTLALEQYALAPVSVTGGGSSAMVGFSSAEIEAHEGATFVASSRMDNLRVVGSGFTLADGYGYSGSGMTLELDAKDEGVMTVLFKVLDRDVEYDLAMKHWITGSRPAVVSVWANPDPQLTPSQVVATPPTVRRYVTEHEGEGGDGNLTMVSLRDLGFGSVDYHDYLVLGLNRLVIQIGPSADSPDPVGAGDLYVLRALSIA